MSQSDVFRPSNGDLLVRDPIASGSPIPTDTFRKRPSTQGGYRFGQLSRNSFFTRHNPHPERVRHIKGLLDVPICAVNDNGYFANPRYSLQFPPNSFNQTKLSNSWRGRIPVNAINVNSQLHPINTVTGLQYFTGLNSYPFRERAIPNVGMVPVTEAWRDELRSFTNQIENLQVEKRKEDERPRTTMYSADTGRLIPPPSRAMSRGASRRGQRERAFGNMQHISADPDVENMVISMLCQILQTEDINAVQAWLCSAGEREKTIVQELIRSALAGRAEYWKQYPTEFVDPDKQRTILPPINGERTADVDGKSDILVIDDMRNPMDDGGRWSHAVVPGEPAMPVPPPSQPQLPMAPKTPCKSVVEDDDVPVKPPSNDVFKPTKLDRPATQATRIPTGHKQDSMNALGDAEPRLKYTKSPTKDVGTHESNLWSQGQSVSNNTF